MNLAKAQLRGFGAARVTACSNFTIRHLFTALLDVAKAAIIAFMSVVNCKQVQRMTWAEQVSAGWFTSVTRVAVRPHNCYGKPVQLDLPGLGLVRTFGL